MLLLHRHRACQKLKRKLSKNIEPRGTKPSDKALITASPAPDSEHVDVTEELHLLNGLSEVRVENYVERMQRGKEALGEVKEARMVVPKEAPKVELPEQGKVATPTGPLGILEIAEGCRDPVVGKTVDAKTLRDLRHEEGEAAVHVQSAANRARGACDMEPERLAQLATLTFQLEQKRGRFDAPLKI